MTTLEEGLEEVSRWHMIAGDGEPYVTKREIDAAFLASIVLYQMFRPVNYLMEKVKYGIFKEKFEAQRRNSIGGGVGINM